MIQWGDPTSFLWLVPAFVLFVLWIRTPIFVTARGKRILLWLKMAILILITLAMFDPKWQTKTIRENFGLTFAIDVSTSVDPASQEEAFTLVASICSKLPKNVEPRFLAFDGSMTTIEPPNSHHFLGKAKEPLKAFIASLRREAGSDLGSALEESVKQISPGQRGKVIFFSDGRDTGGNVGAALERVSETNIPVFTVPLESAKPPPVPQILRAVFPEQIFAGEEVSAQVLLYHPIGGQVTIELNGTDGNNVTRQVSVYPGMSAHSFSFKPPKVGTMIYTVRSHNTSEGGSAAVSVSTVRVKPLPRVMVFQSNTQEGRFLLKTLEAERIDYVECYPGSWPKDLTEEIKQHSCLIMNNIHKSSFRDSELTAIRNAAREGVGLLMTGGPNSFGMGEYTDTPIEEALPVLMPRRTINQGLALVLVLDCSGSMAGDPWNYLIQATKEILRLCRGQFVGVMLFNHYPYWVIPIQQINDPEPFCDLMDQYEPGGGTLFSLPLVQALVGLKDLSFPKKSIMMMSDGVPADFGHVISLMENFREYGVPVTTIAAGNDVNSSNLRYIAEETHGEFYESPQFSELPNLFKKEFKRLSGPPYIEEAISPVLLDSKTVAKGITQAEIPTLQGIILTQRKKRTNLIMATNRGDPILTVWRYGLGKTAAFSSDLLPSWSGAWAKWNGFGKLMRQLIKDLSENVREKFTLQATPKGADVILSVDPGTENKVPFVRLEIMDQGGQKKLLSLQPGAEGRYEAVFKTPKIGVYACKVFVQGPSLVGETIFGVNESKEQIPGPVNFPLLRTIAEKTGGEALDSLRQPLNLTFEGGGEITLYIPLWPWFAFAALLLYILDIYLRKANVFGISGTSELKERTEENTSEIYLQLAQKFSNMAEEHSLKGEVEDAKRYYLRAKAFFMKAQATKEANTMWERYKRFEGR